MKYRVRVSNEFRTITSAARATAGISVPQDGEGYVGELKKDQLKELLADRYVSVTTEDGKPVERDESRPATPVSTEAANAQAAEDAQNAAEEQAAKDRADKDKADKEAQKAAESAKGTESASTTGDSAEGTQTASTKVEKSNK